MASQEEIKGQNREREKDETIRKRETSYVQKVDRMTKLEVSFTPITVSVLASTHALVNAPTTFSHLPAKRPGALARTVTVSTVISPVSVPCKS